MFVRKARQGSKSRSIRVVRSVSRGRVVLKVHGLRRGCGGVIVTLHGAVEPISNCTGVVSMRQVPGLKEWSTRYESESPSFSETV
jgi:hypothetical protein